MSMKYKTHIIIPCLCFFIFFECKKQESNSDENFTKITPEGMVWIPGGTFEQGAVPQELMAKWEEIQLDLEAFKV